MPKAVAVPLSKIEVGDPPPQTRSKADRWAKFDRLMEDVRGLMGRSAKICHHPSHLIASTLKKRYPAFAFTTRKIQVGSKETYGVWARLVVSGEVVEVTGNPLTEPVE